MFVRRFPIFGPTVRESARLVPVFALIAVAAHVVHAYLPFGLPGIEFSAVAMLGSALAIFLGFRNNSAYDRWWEARKLWGQQVNLSRSWARQVLSLLRPAGEAETTEAASLQRELVRRHIAFTHAMRLHLRRQQEEMAALSAYLPDGEMADHLARRNVPAALMQAQALGLRHAAERGWLDSIREARLDETLSEALDVLGGCERIKNTPLPRQYHYVPRLVGWVYVLMLPFPLVDELGILTSLVTVPLSYAFYLLELAGRSLEDPFENSRHDTPMTALCATIEADLLQYLGETDVPAPVEAVDGILY